jgi:hypothetical protein
MLPPARNWSWDHLPVQQYAAMDVEKLRNGGAKVEAKEGQTKERERKRLFYFSDAAE